jgi:hypothetical protein
MLFPELIELILELQLQSTLQLIFFEEVALMESPQITAIFKPYLGYIGLVVFLGQGQLVL